MNEISYCQRILTTFKEEYSKLNVRRNQFAALSIDYAGLDGANVIQAESFFPDGGLFAQNFITATCCKMANSKRILHAEERVLLNFRENMENLSRVFSHNRQHTVIFFTYYSPCEKCTIVLEEQLVCFMRDNFPNVRIVICFAKFYIYKHERNRTLQKGKRNDTCYPDSSRSFTKFKNMENLHQNIKIVHLGKHDSLSSFASADVLHISMGSGENVKQRPCTNRWNHNSNKILIEKKTA